MRRKLYKKIQQLVHS